LFFCRLLLFVYMVSTATSAHWSPGALLETFSSTNALIGYLWFFGIAMILAGFAF